uniref:Capsid protein n=1 Tax=Gongylonema pulchrum TaxID=637853 RepID=A0A183DDW1_9BILA
LSSDVDVVTMRSRTMFYASLMRLLSLDLNDNDTVFYAFLQPLTG